MNILLSNCRRDVWKYLIHHLWKDDLQNTSTGMQRTWSRAPLWLSYSGLETWSYLVRNIFCWWKWLIFSNSSFFFDVTISKQNINGRIIILIICRMRVIMKLDLNLIEQCWSFYYDVCDVGSKYISTWNMNSRKTKHFTKSWLCIGEY